MNKTGLQDFKIFKWVLAQDQISKQPAIMPITGAPLTVIGQIWTQPKSLVKCYFFHVFTFVGSTHQSVRTCRLQSRALSGEGNTPEVPGTVRGPQERSGEEKQQRKHFTRSVILSSKKRDTPQDKRIKNIYVNNPRFGGSSVSLLGDLRCYYGYIQMGDVIGCWWPLEIRRRASCADRNVKFLSTKFKQSGFQTR